MSTCQLVSPMCRLTDRMVRSGLVMAWRFATSPTSTSSDLEKPTTDGVVRPPSALGMTVGSPASRTLTTELVVPRSMPTALGMGDCLREREGEKAHRIEVESLAINSGAPGAIPPRRQDAGAQLR